jgi:hypothetical protein
MFFLNNILNKNSSKIFIISFLILFFELTLIRYISASIVSISFYSNIILLASFFGVGAGCLLNIKRNLFNYVIKDYASGGWTFNYVDSNGIFNPALTSSTIIPTLLLSVEAIEIKEASEFSS